MRYLGPLALALAGFALPAANPAAAAVIEQDFSTGPAGWKYHGDTNLFVWDSANRNLRVTWDSSKPNSYFYHPLGTLLTKDDPFSLEFELELAEIQAGSLQLAIGFLNLADATAPGFFRGSGSDSPNLAELDYFHEWASLSSTTSDTGGRMQFKYPEPATLALGARYRVVLTHEAGSGFLEGQVFQAGTVVASFTNQYANAAFSDFRLDAVAVMSYSDENSWGSSLFARGAVDSLKAVVPDPPVGAPQGLMADGAWQVRFPSQTNWIYHLERTVDWSSWSEPVDPQPGNGRWLTLQDRQPPANRAFYRVRANRP